MRFLLLPLFSLTLTAQTPAFEVASIRPGNRTTTVPGTCGRVDVSSDTVLNPESFVHSGVQRLRDLIEDAYWDEVDDFDLPQWTVNNGVFAISVKMPANTTARTCRKMLQALLAERFHLVVSVETRDVAHYHVKVAKSGTKLKPAGTPATDPSLGIRFEVKDGVTRYTFRGTPMSRLLRIVEGNAAIDARARSLRDPGSVRDPGYNFASVGGIVDETGLTGYYDGEYTFSMTGALHDEFAESLSDSLTRQLGLTLERRRSPGKVLVLTSSDRMPTEN